MSTGKESLKSGMKASLISNGEIQPLLQPNSLHMTHILQRLNKGHCSPISQVNKSESEMRCFLNWNNAFPIGENVARDETQ